MTSSSPRNQDSQNGSVESLIETIYAMLASGQLPKHCVVCGSASTTVRDVRVDQEHLQVTVPLSTCRRCAGHPPFTTGGLAGGGNGPLWAIFLGVLFLLGEEWALAAICLAVAPAIFFWQRFKRSAQPRRGATLEELLRSIPPYEALLKHSDESTFLETASSGERHEFHGSVEAERFARSVLWRIRYSVLASDAELQKACVPIVVLHSYLEIIERRIVQVFQEIPDRPSAIVQVGAVLLPGRRLEFDIVAAMESGSSKTFLRQLKSEMESVPAWPVAYPVVLVVQRIFGTPRERLYGKLSPPFAMWNVLAGDENGQEQPTYAEMAMRFYDLKPNTEPFSIKMDDCEALCRCLPESVPLKFYRAWMLRANGRFAEALAVYDELKAEQPECENEIEVERATCLADSGQLERAAALCQLQISRQPDHSGFIGVLAQIQLNLNQPEEALKTIDRAVSDRHDAGVLQIRAQILAELSRFDEAVSSLNLAIFQNMDYAPAYFLRARIYLYQGRAKDAVADLEQFDRCSEPTYDSLLLKASALVKVGRAQEAEQCYRSLVEEHPTNLPLRLQMAEFLAQTGKLESAKQECDAVIDQMEEFGPAYSVRANVFLELQQFEDAIADADRAIDLTPDAALAWLVRGIAKAALDDVDQAFDDLDRCVEIAPNYALARLHRGRLRSQFQEYESAVAEFTAALEIAPDWTDALVERGYAFLALEQHVEARQDFQKAIEVDPEASNAYTGRAITWLIDGNKVAAAEDLDRAVELNPADVGGRMNRVMLLLQKHEAELARKDLDEILAVEPDFGSALFQRAHLHLNQGQFEEAKKDFDRLIEINPNVPEVFVGRSVALDQVGKSDQAEADQEQARELAPFSAEELAASRALLAASVASQNEQFDKAIELATQLIDDHPDRLWDAYRLRGHAQWYSEKFVEALEDYSAIIEQSGEPTRHDYSAYGQVLAELGEFEQAIDPLNESIQIAEAEQDLTGLAYSLNGKGRALAGLGRFAEAEECYSKSLELKRENAWLHYNRGLMYWEMEKFAEALECFETSLEVDSPKLPPSKRQRAEGAIRSLRANLVSDSAELPSPEPEA